MYVSYRRRIYCCTLLSRWSISESRISKNERESRAVDLETIKPDIIAGLIVAINMRVVDTFYLTSQTHSFIHFERIFFIRVLFFRRISYILFQMQESISNVKDFFWCGRGFFSHLNEFYFSSVNSRIFSHARTLFNVLPFLI